MTFPILSIGYISGPSWEEIADIDFSVSTGTSWTVDQDINADPLSDYDKIYIAEDNADGGDTLIEVRTSAGTWITGATDYLKSYRTDGGEAVAETTSWALRQLTSGSNASASLTLVNFGLAVRTHGWGSEWASASTQKCLSFGVEVDDSSILDALRFTSGSSRSAGRLKIVGKKK